MWTNLAISSAVFSQPLSLRRSLSATTRINVTKGEGFDWLLAGFFGNIQLRPKTS
jgi:hypothetical protein